MSTPCEMCETSVQEEASSEMQAEFLAASEEVIVDQPQLLYEVQCKQVENRIKGIIHMAESEMQNHEDYLQLEYKKWDLVNRRRMETLERDGYLGGKNLSEEEVIYRIVGSDDVVEAITPLVSELP